MAYLINTVKRHKYTTLHRIDSPEGRKYVTPEGVALPSVTTILDGTKDKSHLDSWVKNVGQVEADRIKNEAALVGTHMHGCLERFIKHRPIEVPTSWLAVRGYRMAMALAEKFFPNIDEVWGAEVVLYYPGKYAGTTDLAGVYRGKTTIMDFKQTNKMKQRAWIEDYFHQLAAYALAHDILHGTNIEQGAIFMASQGGELQEFVSVGREWEQYKSAWERRLEAFFALNAAPPLS
jgi:genome maintenance exonuclease 1